MAHHLLIGGLYASGGKSERHGSCPGAILSPSEAQPRNPFNDALIPGGAGLIEMAAVLAVMNLFAFRAAYGMNTFCIQVDQQQVVLPPQPIRLGNSSCVAVN